MAEALIAGRDAGGRLRSHALTVALLVLSQLGLGLANMVLLAPTALQILHLLLADLVWMALVILAASAREELATAPAATAVPLVDQAAAGGR